ncbi:MAG: putative toxin-antitoxin system toxin component, PIN family [Nitrososphaerales archaeon]
MVRVVIDTNVLVSALVGHGRPRALVSLLLEEHTILSSTELLAELSDVLSREKFTTVRRSQVNEFLTILTSKVVIVKTKSIPKIVAQDPDDDVVLAVASGAEAQYVISGDRHLLSLEKFEGISIISVGQMLGILQK